MAVVSTGNLCKVGIFCCELVPRWRLSISTGNCTSLLSLGEVSLVLLPEQNLLEQQHFPGFHSSPPNFFFFAAIGANHACLKRLHWFWQAALCTALASQGHQLCCRCRAPRARIPPTSKCPGALGAVCYQGICWLVFSLSTFLNRKHYILVNRGCSSTPLVAFFTFLTNRKCSHPNAPCYLWQ